MTSNISQNLWHIWEQAPLHIVTQGIQEAFLIDPNRSLPNNRGGWETRERDRTTLPYPTYFYNGELRGGRTFTPSPDQYSWWGPGTLAAPFVPQIDSFTLRQKGPVAEDGIPLNEPPDDILQRLSSAKQGVDVATDLKRKYEALQGELAKRTTGDAPAPAADSPPDYASFFKKPAPTGDDTKDTDGTGGAGEEFDEHKEGGTGGSLTEAQVLLGQLYGDLDTNDLYRDNLSVTEQEFVRRMLSHAASTDFGAFKDVATNIGQFVGSLLRDRNIASEMSTPIFNNPAVAFNWLVDKKDDIPDSFRTMLLDPDLDVWQKMHLATNFSEIMAVKENVKHGKVDSSDLLRGSILLSQQNNYSRDDIVMFDNGIENLDEKVELGVPNAITGISSIAFASKHANVSDYLADLNEYMLEKFGIASVGLDVSRFSSARASKWADVLAIEILTKLLPSNGRAVLWFDSIHKHLSAFRSGVEKQLDAQPLLPDQVTSGAADADSRKIFDSVKYEIH
jgi:hypothetical protein